MFINGSEIFKNLGRACPNFFVPVLLEKIFKVLAIFPFCDAAATKVLLGIKFFEQFLKGKLLTDVHTDDDDGT